GDGQIVNATAGDSELLVQCIQFRLELGISTRVAETARYIKQRAGVVGPMALVEGLSRKARDAVARPLANVFVRIAILRFLGARQAETHDREMRGQRPVHV